ncbi:MAG: hypothetical protein LBL57_09605 [Tannerella sp.]|jgi:hypothetical protein|nr:hypothetical protein [Tannerella sp.]
MMRYAGLLRPASTSAFPEKPVAFYSKARLQFKKAGGLLNSKSVGRHPVVQKASRNSRQGVNKCANGHFGLKSFLSIKRFIKVYLLHLQTHIHFLSCKNTSDGNKHENKIKFMECSGIRITVVRIEPLSNTAFHGRENATACREGQGMVFER